jgi:hypothetical protein
MKICKKTLIVLLLFLFSLPVFGQEFGMGAILDPVLYEQTPSKPLLLSRDYSSIPRSYSLKQYSPIPESQGGLSTCVGWATAYAARTISESIALNRTDRQQSSNSVFSPLFVYIGHYILQGITPTGGEGAVIGSVLDYIKSEGAVKRTAFERTTPFHLIFLSLYNNIRRYTISDYVKLFSNPRGTPGTISERVVPVKKSLSEGKPVIIAMNTPPSFFTVKDLWRPWESYYIRYGGHAMCVVGYDDDKYGGIFEIQNSWGTNWGNGGYFWVQYQDFANWVNQAYEIIENLANYQDAVNYAASIKIEVYGSSNGMPVTFDRQGFYKTRSSYPSGTDFCFLMTNKHPAYVYAFSADSSTSDTERIFPLHGVSPVIDYPDCTIAWPGELDWIRLNDVTGTDYLIVLYSKQALDIDAIEKRFANERGTFPQRVAHAVGSDFIPYGDVQYKDDVIEFSTLSYNSKAVLGLLLAIDHRAR